MTRSGYGSGHNSLSSQTAPIMPSGPYCQNHLGAHSLKSLQRNRVALEKKENKAGSQEPWVQVPTLPLTSMGIQANDFPWPPFPLNQPTWGRGGGAAGYLEPESGELESSSQTFPGLL